MWGAQRRPRGGGVSIAQLCSVCSLHAHVHAYPCVHSVLCVGHPRMKWALPGLSCLLCPCSSGAPAACCPSPWKARSPSACSLIGGPPPGPQKWGAPRCQDQYVPAQQAWQ